MALEQGIKPGTYAMMERGARTPTPAVLEGIQALREKFPAPYLVVSFSNFTLSGDVLTLLEQARLTTANIHEQLAYCTMEIFDLQRKLAKIRLRFNKALAIVKSADVQLKEIADNGVPRRVLLLLAQKRDKAMKLMEDIIKQNPVRLMVRLNVLQQEEALLEAAAEKGAAGWLNDEVLRFVTDGNAGL